MELRFLTRGLNPRPHLPPKLSLNSDLLFSETTLRKIKLEQSPASKLALTISQSAFVACVEASP